MRTVKRILILVLVAGMLLSLLPAVHAEDVFAYEVRDNGVWITGGRFGTDPVIPAQIDETPVVGIARSAFAGLTEELTSVQLPETLRYIEDYAIPNCNKLREPIVIPDGVEWISPYAFGSTRVTGKAYSAAERAYLANATPYFRKNGTLEGYETVVQDGITYWVHDGEAELVQIGPDLGTTLELPETVGGYPLTALGPFSFMENTGDHPVRNVIVPKTVRALRDHAFRNSGVYSVYLCEGVQTLGAYCLDLGNGTAYITLPRSAELVDPQAFQSASYSSNNSVVYAYRDSTGAREAAAQHCTVISREGGDGMTYGVWGGLIFGVADGTAKICRSVGSSPLFLPEQIEDWRVTKLDLNRFASGNFSFIPASVTQIDLDKANVRSTTVFLVCPGSYGERFCKANRLNYESVYTYLGVPFTDTPADRWYYDAVCYCYRTGLMSGVSKTGFAPNNTTSRAMLVTVLWRMAGCPDAKTPCSFLDVAAGAWYTDSVAWAQENGIVNGVGDGRFDPNGVITREQLATVLCRYVGGKADARGLSEVAEFPDAGRISPWALDAFAWAKTTGILKGQLSGSQVYLNPRGNTTRAELATVLMRLN